MTPPKTSPAPGAVAEHEHSDSPESVHHDQPAQPKKTIVPTAADALRRLIKAAQRAGLGAKIGRSALHDLIDGKPVTDERIEQTLQAFHVDPVEFNIAVTLLAGFPEPVGYHTIDQDVPHSPGGLEPALHRLHERGIIWFSPEVFDLREARFGLTSHGHDSAIYAVYRLLFGLE